MGGHKHTFQASTDYEQGKWIAVLRAEIDKAKDLAAYVIETEEYRNTYLQLTKPAD